MDIDILLTPFYKHLFFDSYILKSDGYNVELTCNIFSKYLKNYGISNTFTAQFNGDNYNNYLIKYVNNYYKTLQKIILEPELFKEYDNFILLSGYQNDNGGHAVTIYIEKKISNYTISIINSGEGVENHEIKNSEELIGGNKPRGNINSKYSILLQYDNINFDTIINLIKFTFLMHNFKLRTIIKKNILIFENYDYQLLDFFIYSSGNMEDDSFSHNTKDILKERKINIDKLISSNEDEINSEIFDKIKKQEIDIYINNYLPFIKEFIKKENEYNVIYNNTTIELFYSYIKYVIPNFNKPSFYIRDNIQESSSCYFFSIYYLLKFKFFENDIEFDNFINYIKKNLVEYLLEQIDKEIDINIINSAIIIIKDHMENNFLSEKIIELEEKIQKIFKNDFYRIKNNKKYDYYSTNSKMTIYKKDEYNEFKKNVNFSTYLNFIDNLIINTRIYTNNLLLFNYMFYKASFLCIKSLSDVNIIDEEDFILFFKNIKKLCRYFKIIENTEYFKISLNDLKIKFFNKFMKILESFELIKINDFDNNIFNEYELSENKDTIINYICHFEYVQIYDFDIDIDEIKNNFINNFDIIILKSYFGEINNDGEFFYLLHFNEYQYSKFIQDYKINKKHYVINDDKLLFEKPYKYTDYNYLNELIDSLNSSDIQKVINLSSQETNSFQLVSNLPLFDKLIRINLLKVHIVILI